MLPAPTTWTVDTASEIAALSEAAWGRERVVRLLGVSDALSDALERLRLLAKLDKPMLLCGESGVGKELFARSAYVLSRRKRGPFIAFNCARLSSENLLISQLFGHRRGAFTGAQDDRHGLFERANEGVLFLDEVGELTPKAQAALLRVLAEGEVTRLGEAAPRRVNVRVIAATNRDLIGMMHEGTFRKDLYFRLAPLRVDIPPLRERGADWRIIAEAYVAKLCRQTDEDRVLGEDALRVLEAYQWPGNIRQMQGLLETSFCLTAQTVIGPDVISREIELSAVSGDRGGSRSPSREPSPFPLERAIFSRMASGEVTFWKAVRDPYLDRDLNRCQVRRVLRIGLERARWSYKRTLPALGLEENEYLRFMDFLRHHKLKPERRG